jgi:hypothetical protein
MSNLVVTIHKNVDFSIPAGIEQEQAITSNEFSSILAPAIRRAWLLAHSLGHAQVLVEHFITALFAEEESRRILERHGFSDDDGERGQKLTKRRTAFGAPTFDQSSISPGKLLASRHLDAWFRAARNVAGGREKEHVTLVVEDFIRALDQNFPFDDKELAAETKESLEFVRRKLSQQGNGGTPPFKTLVIHKIDEVLKELRGEVNAANAARAKAMELLTAGLHQLEEKVDGINPAISFVKAEIDNSIHADKTARSSELEFLAVGLRQLIAKVNDLNPVISASHSELDTNISAAKTEIQKGSAKLSAIEHYVAVSQNNLTMQFKSIQESLTYAHEITHKQLTALADQLSREFGSGRVFGGLLPVIAIAAGTGIALIARFAFGPLY